MPGTVPLLPMFRPHLKGDLGGGVLAAGQPLRRAGSGGMARRPEGTRLQPV
jgi:hypothetical protein